MGASLVIQNGGGGEVEVMYKLELVNEERWETEMICMWGKWKIFYDCTLLINLERELGVVCFFAVYHGLYNFHKSDSNLIFYSESLSLINLYVSHQIH